MEDCHITEDLNLPVALISSYCHLVVGLNGSVELKVCNCYLAAGKWQKHSSVWQDNVESTFCSIHVQSY